MKQEELLMGNPATTDIARHRVVVPAAAGAVPLLAPFITDAPSFAAVAVSGVVMVLASLRPLLLVLLHHFRETQQQHNQHAEAIMREDHHHAEVMLMLHKVSEDDEIHVDVAGVVAQIRKPA
ncbi:hypothetical protein [Streptomyces sp. H39-C1]|uniref:hypothetical protein n=1 Tax=Streptomyces sp. H39-C1 TaxID=3004355 RepID=UPI0022AF25DA|nr:hypothetical protein [Streptomyces sp. H39-C1]MCZ4101943.1 hypothetical protein [Streptomyces sp. H39-C1]